MKQLKYITGCVILLVNITNCIAQELLKCGSNLPQQEMNIIRSTATQRKQEITNWKMNGGAFKPRMLFLPLPVQAHIVLKKTGEGDNAKYCGLTQTKLAAAIDTVNRYYITNNVGIELVMCGPVHYIYDNNFYDCSEDEFNTLKQMYNVKNVLNIYFTGTVATYAGLGGKDGVVVMKDVLKSTALVHEIGHYLSLAHTHGDGDGVCPKSDEFADGSNCETAGDGFCDTPADPNLYYACGGNPVDDKTCTYIGTAKDAHGDSYHPLTNNIMSYSPQHCRTSFTGEQSWQMRYALEQRMLFCCSDEAPGYLVLNQAVSGINHYDAEDSIKAYNSVEATSIINYTAGQKVRLTNKFIAKKGCHLKISLSACTKFPNIPDPVNCYANNVMEEMSPDDKLTTDNIAVEDNLIALYPNPFTNIINLKINNQSINLSNVDIKIFNAEGKLLLHPLQKTVKNGFKQDTFVINATHLTPGVYYCIITIDGKQSVKKLIK